MDLKIVFCLFFLCVISFADTIQEGKKEIQEGMKGARPMWSYDAFQALPKVWGKNITSGSLEFKEEIRKRYGLYYDNNFPNDGLPVGMTKTHKSLTPGVSGIVIGCQTCHSARSLGVTSDSITNVFFDYNRLYQDIQTSMGEPKNPFFEVNIDRNSMASFSNYMGRLSVFVRNNFPWVNYFRLYAVFADPNANNDIVQPLKAELPYRDLVKTQPWANYSLKKPHGGLLVDASNSSSPSGTHYANHFTLNVTGADFVNAVRHFDKVVPDYFNSLKPPRYPKVHVLNRVKVNRGHEIYTKNCAGCHGNFKSVNNEFVVADFPGKLIDRKVVKTDTLRIDYKIEFDSEVPEYILKQFKKTSMYMAPPLHAIWARAPYLHNASVPTLSQLLNPKTRMKKYSIRAEPDAFSNYDEKNVGWIATDLSPYSNAEIEKWTASDPAIRVYDSDNHLGMSNEGHLFGETLSDEEKDNLIEFLKGV